jgi:hypothetical protein
MKIGIIYCGYNAEDYLPGSLSPWIKARKSQLGGHDWIICAVAVPFENFVATTPDHTIAILRIRLALAEIDHLITSAAPLKETVARTQALQWLAGQKVDVYWMVDSDEFYTTDEIERIATFVTERPLVAWYRLCLRNYVFDERTYLVEPFTPPRIYRAEYAFRNAVEFYDDNNIAYNTVDGALVRDNLFPSATVPKAVGWIAHKSWLNNSRSRDKVRYQEARSWRCTFAWDESRGGLVWRDTPQETARDS